MKLTRSQFSFLGNILFWVVVLQGVMLWYLSTSTRFICNGSGAWPLSSLPLLGSTFLSLLFTILVAVWAWKTISQDTSEVKGISVKPFFWALLVATGLSHSIERATSQCIVDYWHLPFFRSPFYFNLGDVSLTVGTILIIGYWYWESKK